MFIASCALLLACLGWSLWDGVRTWSSAANAYLASIEDVRSLPLRLWILILIFAFGLAALRVARGRTGQMGSKLASHRTLLLFGLGLMLYCFAAAGAVWQFRSMERQREVAYDLRHIMIKGRVLDDRGAPVEGIRVDLVPIFEDGEAPHWVCDPAFTDENGEYTLRPRQAGRFTLSVQADAPPNTEHPFQSRYYPDAADLKDAKVLEIAPTQHVILNPIRLQRLGLAKVSVSVFWSDGTPEPDVMFSFINTSYPNFGAIGQMMPAAPDGTVALPIGYKYLGTANAQCDKGGRMEGAYSTGWTFSLKTADALKRPLRIVLPVNRCWVWQPR